MVRYARKVLKIRELSPFVLKFPVEFVPVFQKDLGWPTVYIRLLFYLLSASRPSVFIETSRFLLEFLPFS